MLLYPLILGLHLIFPCRYNADPVSSHIPLRYGYYAQTWRAPLSAENKQREQRLFDYGLPEQREFHIQRTQIGTQHGAGSRRRRAEVG